MEYPHARITGLMAVTVAAAAAALVTTVGTSAAITPAQQVQLAQQVQPARSIASIPQEYVMWDLASEFGITATNPQPDS